MNIDSEYLIIEIRKGTAVLLINNPPVNVLSVGVRKAIMEGIAYAETNDQIHSIIISSKGRLFSAGADIGDFEKPPKAPVLSSVIEKIGVCSKPVVAAIHGMALGAGLEVALMCHFRLADPSSKFGLPEVKIGLIPGAGGTQLLPRMIGPQKALDMILSGEMTTSQSALEMGLIDKIIQSDLIDGAVMFANEIFTLKRSLPRWQEKDEKVALLRGNQAFFEDYRNAVRSKSRNLEAPLACIEAIEASVNLTLPEGLLKERILFERLKASPQSAAQRYIFYSERRAGKTASIPKEIIPTPIETAAVIGGGMMGRGIAMCFADAGIPVTIVEVTQEFLARSLNSVRKSYELKAAQGKISTGQKNKRMSLIQGTLSLEDVSGSDIVIEAVYENMDLKKELFSKLDQICKPNTILATNTSYLDVNKIGDSTRRPANVLGMHFFSPANVMRLLEVVRADKTSNHTLISALNLAKRLKKISVIVGVCHGFAGNRMYARRKIEAKRLILEGALPAQVDQVITNFGFPMGPFALFDLVGVDFEWSKATSTGSTIDEILCEMGRLGLKAGAGYYSYKKNSRIPEHDPEVDSLIVAFSKRQGIQRRSISEEEILQRCIFSVINEGAKIIDDGIVSRPSDLDVIWVNGYGWPRFLGGPMFYADSVGMDKVLSVLKEYHTRLGDDWEPAPLIEKLSAAGKGFRDIIP
jgi:3-hydroxyacyl-CoA dehydrogenase